MNREHFTRWLDTHEQEWIDDTIALVSIPSVSVKLDKTAPYPFGETCARALDKALEIGSRCGFETQNHEYYCGSALWQGETAEEIALMMHLDVVPVGSGWTYEPFVPKVEGRLLIGRGSRDNKMPGLAVLYAVRYLMEQGVKLKHSIRFLFGCNEELGMEDAVYYREHCQRQPVFFLAPDGTFPVCHGEKGVLEVNLSAPLGEGVLADFIAGEASNMVPAEAVAVLRTAADKVLPLIRSGSGIAAEPCPEGCRVTATGTGAHTAYPEGSDNAALKLAAFLAGTGLLAAQESKALAWLSTAFSGYYGEEVGIACEDDASGKLTCVASVVRVKEGRLCQNLNIRYPVEETAGWMVEKIRENAAAAGFALDSYDDNPGYYLDPSHPAVQPLNDLCNRVLGTDLPPYVAKGGTYCRKMSVPAVSCGCGFPGKVHPFGPDRGTGHKPDEAADIDDYKIASYIYAEALLLLDELL